MQPQKVQDDSSQFIPLSVPNLKGNELAYVAEAIQSEWVSTAGPYVERFENELANYVGLNSAVACQSGTAGLHTALRLLEIGPGDAVLVPALTFIAAVNPISYQGAEPIFMDCDDSLCMDPVKVREFCKDECIFREGDLIHKESGRTIKAIVVVHVFGNMADMLEFLDIASEFNLKIVEDATEALGTFYEDGPLAGKFAGTIGDIGVYSFNGNKIITTGGGGMIVSQSEILLQKAKHLTTQAKSDPLYFEHDEIGFNYRLTNVQAAIGLAQLEQLEKFILAKKENYELYRELLSTHERLTLMPFNEGTRPNYWFYSLLCSGGAPERDSIIKYLAEECNIQTRPVWGLINKQKPYKSAICYRIERAVWYRERIVNIPCSSNLEPKDIERVSRSIMAGVSDAA